MNENKTITLSCSGADESKHPQVYLLLDANKVTICPYCSKEFTKDEENHD